MSTQTTAPTSKTKRHPIRGFLYGIVFGLGLAFIAVGQSWAALGTWPPFLLLIAGVVIGTLWSTFGPAKGPKVAPAAAAPMAADAAATAGTVAEGTSEGRDLAAPDPALEGGTAEAADEDEPPPPPPA